MLDAATVTREILKKWPDSAPCSCSACRRMCKRPCWPIPAEVQPLIDAGEGKRLMLDWWEGDFHGGEHDRVYLVSPASPGCEGGTAPEMEFTDLFSVMLGGSTPLHAGCVFDDGKGCVLHARGLKPLEGRAAHHAGKQGSNLHKDVAREWDTEEGRTVVAQWCKVNDLDNPYETGDV